MLKLTSLTIEDQNRYHPDKPPPRFAEMSEKHEIFFVFDVESVGLHGEGFAVGYVAVENGREVESGLFFCAPAGAAGTAKDYGWVVANVIPALSDGPSGQFGSRLGSESPRDVRCAFWDRWVAWKGRGALMVADCPWPVESRFLMDCLRDNPAERASMAPYPIIDVGSVRLAAGLDPLGTNDRRDDERPAHNPLADARQSARLLIEALTK